MGGQRRFRIFDALFYVFAGEKAAFDAWEKSAGRSIVAKVNINGVGAHIHNSLNKCCFHNILLVELSQYECGVFMVVEPNKELTDVTNILSGLPIGLCVGVTNIRLGDGSFIKVRQVVVEKHPSETSLLIAPYRNKNENKNKKNKKRRNIENIKKTCKTKSKIKFEGDHPVPFYKKGRW